MSEKTDRVAGGLEGVVVADTVMSHIDGAQGQLVVRGFDAEALAERAGFEDVCALLWSGALPDVAGRRDLAQRLGDARVAAFARLDRIGDALAAADGMDALRAALAHLHASPDDEPGNRVRLSAAVAVFAAAWWRVRSGLEPLAPDPRATHAADYLRMATGEGGHPARALALDRYLVTVAEHGMNASTFTARVVASTDSDSVSAVVAALGALKGPLHGGAPGPVLEMLDRIGQPERAADWIAAELAAGRRIMGMGHREYRVRDPRAAVLEKAVHGLRAAGLSGDRLELAQAVERVAAKSLEQRHPERRLEANVEFYTAVLLDALGLPVPMFTPTFAVGRVVGWLAHIQEQRDCHRIIRPRSRYVGVKPAA